jgi:hypothetical protein
MRDLILLRQVFSEKKGMETVGRAGDATAESIKMADPWRKSWLSSLMADQVSTFTVHARYQLATTLRPAPALQSPIERAFYDLESAIRAGFEESPVREIISEFGEEVQSFMFGKRSTVTSETMVKVRLWIDARMVSRGWKTLMVRDIDTWID